MKKYFCLFSFSILFLIACNSNTGGSSTEPAEPSMVNADGTCTDHYMSLTKIFINQMKSATGSQKINEMKQKCDAHLTKTKGVDCIGVNKDTGNRVTGLQRDVENMCSDVEKEYQRIHAPPPGKSAEQIKMEKSKARLEALGCTVNGQVYDWRCGISKSLEEAQEKYGLLRIFCRESYWDSGVYWERERVCQIASMEIDVFGHNLDESIALLKKMKGIYGIGIEGGSLGDIEAERKVRFLAGLLKLDEIAKKHKIKSMKKYRYILLGSAFLTYNSFIPFSKIDHDAVAIDSSASVTEISDYFKKYLMPK